MKIRREQLLALTLSVVLGVSSTVTAVPVFAKDGNAGAVTQMEVAQENQKAGNVNQPTAGTAKAETAKTETAKTQAAKTEAAKTEAAKTENAKTEDTKAKNTKDETTKTEASDNQDSQENKKQDEKAEDTTKNDKKSDSDDANKKTGIADSEQKKKDEVQKSNNSEASGVVAAQSLGANELAPMAEMKTYSISTTSTMLLTGLASGMYTMDGAIVTEQEDGTYLLRIHQNRVNRNYMAITSDTATATAHNVDWYVAGGADGYWFTVPVKSLDTSLIVCFSSDTRVAAGDAFSNPVEIAFDTASMEESTEGPAVASDIKVLKATNTVEVTNVSLDTTEVSLGVGDTKTLTATVTPDNATDAAVTWTSDKTDIATVTDGLITAVKAGTATITAAAGDKRATCIVTVTDKEAKEELQITNTTGMFKVVSAAIETKDNQSVLRFALNSTGYENLFIGK